MHFIVCCPEVISEAPTVTSSTGNKDRFQCSHACGSQHGAYTGGAGVGHNQPVAALIAHGQHYNRFWVYSFCDQLSMQPVDDAQVHIILTAVYICSKLVLSSVRYTIYMDGQLKCH